MDGERSRSAERERAAAERERARVLRGRAHALRERADLVSSELVESIRGVDGPPLGEDGDGFALRLPRMPVVLGLLRQELHRWLERRDVPPEDASEILLACAEACANAVEHPEDAGRPAFEVDARARPAEIEVCVRDFGRWSSGETVGERRARGRGLRLIRALMDDVAIVEDDAGTRVTMRRRLRPRRPAHSGGTEIST